MNIKKKSLKIVEFKGLRRKKLGSTLKSLRVPIIETALYHIRFTQSL